MYGIFFSVESFYNFEGHSDARTILAHSLLSQQPAASRQAMAVRTSPQPYPFSHNLRLNKRYHEENFPPCPVYQVAAPVCYITPRALGSDVVARLPFITRFHFQLRGPPFAI
ncbi:hypothetical protein [Puia dinghuensis]|uniref:hypothetical protein n=1 Tax=Puia dinghuensis TaxID=1792502 RepID=UPI001E3F38DE|nr:hypothetical protein [Puia dinghuensis]